MKEHEDRRKQGGKYRMEDIMAAVLACLIPIAVAVLIIYFGFGGPYVSLSHHSCRLMRCNSNSNLSFNPKNEN